MVTNLINYVKNFIYESNRDQMRIEATQIMMNAESFKDYLKAFIKVFGMSLEVITTRWYLIDLVIYTILTWIADINEWKIFGILTASVVICTVMVLLYRLFRWVSTPKIGKYLIAVVGILVLASLIGCNYKSESVAQEVKIISKEEQNYIKAIETHSERVDMELTSFPKVTWSYDDAVYLRDEFHEICVALSTDYSHVTAETRKIASILQQYVYLNDLAAFAIYHSEYLKIDPKIEFWFNQRLEEFNSKK